MPTYQADVVVVFGTMLREDGKFPQHVYQQLDWAIELLQAGVAPRIAVCGSHAMKVGLRGLLPECDVAAQYLQESQSSRRWSIHKVTNATNTPENWLFLKILLLEQLGLTLPRIKMVTLLPLLPRITFFGRRIFGVEAELSFDAIPWPSDEFSGEKRLLADARCTLASMEPGDHTFLLYPDGSSRWNELRLAHHACPYYGGIHPA